METKPKIIAIVGPTATGKSDLGVRLAKRFGGEIISADSRQIYRGLDIGSGKITKREMKRIPHHLLDIRDPKRSYSAAHFQRDGTRAIKNILARRKLPIIVGGSGFYIDALLSGMMLPEIKPNLALRKKLAKKSPEELLSMLRALDPRRAEEIDKNNPVRLIRAIEIATSYGSVPPLTQSSPYNVLYIGLHADGDMLKERILKRIIKRMRGGMLREFTRLHEQGLSFKRMEELGLEYRFGARLLQKDITRKQFESELAGEIYKYAKRQKTWFKRNPLIKWLPADDPKNAEQMVEEFLR